MEVTSTSNQGPIQPRRGNADERIDLTRVNRDGIHDATEDIAEIRAPQEPYSVRAQRHVAEEAASRSNADRIEVSEDAKRLLAANQSADETDKARVDRVEELRKQHAEGRLNSRERVERAAFELLSQR
jgi:hypothetical protein